MRFDRSHKLDRREERQLGSAAGPGGERLWQQPQHCRRRRSGHRRLRRKLEQQHEHEQQDQLELRHGPRTGTLPKTGTPSKGGTISIGQITGQTPTDICPMIDGATCRTQTFYFVSNMYIPLYYGPERRHA